MKNVSKCFLFSITIMFLVTSFVSGPISVVKPVGGAFLVFAGKYGGEIKKNELTSNRELKVEGCARGSKIISYTLEVTKKGKKISLVASSNMLSKEMVTKLQTLDPGDTFEFKGIKAYLPNGKDIVDVHGYKYMVV